VCCCGAQAARAVKGILNKLTPENFDRLLAQVLDTVRDAAVLHATILLVFENAVAQPTFAFMYAQLCDRLSKARCCARPSFSKTCNM
jgi:translation initiation factor 4G